MTALPKFSVRLHGGLPPQTCVALAKVADEAGFTGLWFAENPFNRGILPAAAACAVETRHIRIGSGVFNPFNRHPTLMAMEIGALDELAGGRARLGIGSGIGAAVQRMGFSYDRPVSAVSDAIAIVRALLKGEEVTHAGRVFAVNGVKLEFPARADIPIYMAGRGERGLKLCGTAADGLMVSNMCTAAFTREAVPIVHTAARAAGRTVMPEIVQYVPCAVDPDRNEAYRAAKRAVGAMLPTFWALGARVASARYALLTGSSIDAPDFERAVTRIRAGEDAADALDDRFVAAFAVAGTAEECLAQAKTYADAGVTELALTFSGPTATEQMRYFSRALG